MFMDDNATLIQLEELARRIGITIRYEPLTIEGSIHTGGYCRIRGQDFVIIRKNAMTREKIYILIDVLKRFDLSGIYVLPSLRDRLNTTDGP
jgi:hypothetical protein